MLADGGSAGDASVGSPASPRWSQESSPLLSSSWPSSAPSTLSPTATTMVSGDAAAAQSGPGSRVLGCRTTTTPDKADGGAVPSLIRCCGCRCTGCPGIASISYGPSTPPLPVPDLRHHRDYIKQ